MKPVKFLCVCGLAAFLLVGCSRPITTGSPSSGLSDRLQSANGIEMEFVAADSRGGPDVWVTVCYQLPNDAEWVPGRLARDVTLSVDGSWAAMSSLELVGWRASPDGKRTDRCDRIQFSVAALSASSIYTLTVERIAANLSRIPDWAEVQRRLDAAHTGIKIEPIAGAEGFSFAVVQKPADMTDSEASNVVVDIAGDVVEGPWTFTFSIKR